MQRECSAIAHVFSDKCKLFEIKHNESTFNQNNSETRKKKPRRVSSFEIQLDVSLETGVS